VVTVEETVDRLDPHPNALVLPHWVVTAIAEVPGGAHPSYAHGYYPRDNAAYKAWDAIAADRTRFLDWMKTHVINVDAHVFAARVAKLTDG
jgi:glutaconate CoA-transferase subunit A